ncbi:hypothetical protein LMG28140_00699 [Paraburkholderia metrosideri]|uniref:Uncharacterized protein n=1 Tax=Paraburkholderia metrosideri TaxID=580937 RepID=A0ABM8NBV8_9BURK|nr:hypothetical protein LMG28140_00699 [Paraburkholderia metrosideri]
MDHPALLVDPAISLVLSLFVVRIKTQYINEGVLFCWSSSAEHESERASAAEEGEMCAENYIDLNIALKAIHKLAMREGDLGY